MDGNPAKAFFHRFRPIFVWTAAGTAAAVVVSLAAAGALNILAPATAAMRETALATVVAVLVGTPLAFICGTMATRIAALRSKVLRVSQNDGLTSCLNEATFSAMVETYSNQSPAPGSDPLGTILLVNLDDLRVVNSRFGYTWGNEALASVAATIKSTVRNGDIVGRISGDQFGVFLPGANEAFARSVANRIRTNVAKIQFFPTGIRYPLSIRAGAVIVSTRIGFDDLLRKVDGTLAMTRAPGRDWIEYLSLDGDAAGARPGDLQ